MKEWLCECVLVFARVHLNEIYLIMRVCMCIHVCVNVSVNARRDKVVPEGSCIFECLACIWMCLR